MKKNFTILSAILITLFSLTAKAQDEDTQAKSYLALMGGISTPLGDFGKADYSNNKAGFAKKGPTVGFDLGIYLYKNFALGINLAYQDQGELTQDDTQNLANGYNASFDKNETTVNSVGRYQNIHLMVGPQYTFLYKKFALDLRASAGFLKSISTPTQQIIFDYSSNSATYMNVLSSSAIAFSYGGSVGLRWSFADSWDLGLKCNYIDCSGIKIENTNNPGTVGRYQTSQPITEFQTTLGLALKF